jgi:hypothetical protein
LSKGRRFFAQRLSTISVCRRLVVATGDYVRAKTPLRSVLTLTSIAPTPLDVDIRWRRGVDDIRRRRMVVAAGDYVRAKTPLRSVLTLTSIAPTPLDVDIRLASRSRRHPPSSLGRRPRHPDDRTLRGASVHASSTSAVVARR